MLSAIFGSCISILFKFVRFGNAVKILSLSSSEQRVIKRCCSEGKDFRPSRTGSTDERRLLDISSTFKHLRELKSSGNSVRRFPSSTNSVKFLFLARVGRISAISLISWNSKLTLELFELNLKISYRESIFYNFIICQIWHLLIN